MIDTKSARIAIIRATMHGHESPGEHDQAIYGTRIQRSSSTSSAGAIAHGVCAGEILAAVDHQREPVRSWLYVAYAEPPWEWITYSMVQAVHEAIRDEFRQTRRHNISARREGEMLRTVINDQRAALNGQDRLGREDYQRVLGIPRESWHRHYRDHVDAARAIVDDWDKEGRGKVADMLSERFAA